MEGAAFWKDYLAKLNFGQSLETNQVQFAEIIKPLPDRFAQNCKSNINNAKLLLISLLRETAHRTGVKLSFAFTINNKTIPIDSNGVGDYKVGAKELLELSRKLNSYLSELPEQSFSGIIISDESYHKGLSSAIHIVIHANLKTISCNCLHPFESTIEKLIDSAFDLYEDNSILLETQKKDLKHLMEEAKGISIKCKEERRSLIEESWRQVIGETIDWSKSYYSNGGDSIQAIRLLAKLKDKGAVVDLSGLLEAERMGHWFFRIDEAVKANAPIYNDQDKTYGLTEMQERIWKHYLAHKTMGAYHEQFVFELIRYPNIDQIKACLNAVWKSHENIRIHIHEEAGEYWQHIMDDDIDFTTEIFDSIDQALQKDLQKGFHQHLLRVTHLVIADKNYLLWSHHHVLLDGWSVGILMREFVDRMNRHDHLPETKPNFQKQLLAYEESLKKTEIDFTGTHILQKPFVFSIEYYRHDQRFETAFFPFYQVDAEKEKYFLETFEITRQLLYCGVVGLTLSSISGKEPFYFNSISSGRSFLHHDAETAVGLFIRNILVPADIKEGLCWKQYFTELKLFFNQILANDISLGIKEHHQKTHSDFLFIYENYPYEDITSDIFEARLIHTNEITGYPITFCLFPKNGGYEFRVVYDARRFSATFIASLQKKFLYYSRLLLDADAEKEIAPKLKHQIFADHTDYLATDFFEADSMKQIITKQNVIATIGKPLLSEIFDKQPTPIAKSEESISHDAVSYWYDMLKQDVQGFWFDVFDAIKGDLKERHSSDSIKTAEEKLERVMLSLRHLIWKNTNFQIACKRGKMIFPILLDDRTEDREILHELKRQLTAADRYKDLFLKTIQSKLEPRSNILFCLDESSDDDFKLFDLVIKKENTTWKILSRNNISNKFVDKLNDTLYDDKTPEAITIQKLLSIKEASKKVKTDHFLKLFFDQVKKAPDSIAVLDGNRKFTYRELDEHSWRIAKGIEGSYSAEKFDFIGIRIERSFNQLSMILATFKLGKAFIPIEVHWPESRVEQIVKQAKSIIVIDQKKIQLLENSNVEAPADIRYDMDVAAYVLFTSGSTGIPKGCLIQHEALSNYLMHCKQHYFDDDNNYNVHVFTPLAFDFTLTSLLGGIAFGKTVLLHAESKSIYDALGEALRDHQSSFIKLTPSHILLAEKEWFAEATPKCVVVGGEALHEIHIQKVLAHTKHSLYNEYGPTEATVGCIVHKVDLNGIAFIGKSISGMKALVLDGNRQPVRKGVVGELYLLGTGLAKEYLHAPELTQIAFLELNHPDYPKMYKTGDLVKMDYAGNLLYLNRADNQLKLHGYRIEAEEIQSCVRKIFGKESHVAILGTDKSRQLICFVESIAGNSDYSKSLEEVIPKYMIPSHFIEIEKFSTTRNGKLDTDTLYEYYYKSIGEARENASNQIEDVVNDLKIWIDSPESIRNCFTEEHTVKSGWYAISEQIHFLNRILRSYPAIPLESLSRLVLMKHKEAEAGIKKTESKKDSIFIHESGYQIKGAQLLELVNVLSEYKHYLPEVFNPILSKYINEQIRPSSEYHIVPVIAAENLKFIKNGSICILEEWSKKLDFPVVLQRNHIGNFKWLCSDLRETVIYDFLNQPQTDGFSGHCIIDQHRLFNTTSSDKVIYLERRKYINRFANSISCAYAEQVILTEFPEISAALFEDVNEELILFIESEKNTDEATIKNRIRKYLPVWAMPDKIVYSNDFEKEIKTNQKNIAESSQDEWSVFIKKNIPEYHYLKPGHSLIEQGGDSIVALRMIGKLKTKGYRTEVGELLNAPSLLEYVQNLKREEGIKELGHSHETALTPIQQWFLSSYTGNRNHYNQSILLELQIPIEPTQLQEIIDNTLQQFPILSMVYHQNWKAGMKPFVQVIHCNSAEEITETCSKIQEGFDLERGPVAAGVIFTLQSVSYLFVSMHHFYCDGYSWRIFLDELQANVQGMGTVQSGPSVFGLTHQKFLDLALEFETETKQYYQSDINNPFAEWKICSYSNSTYVEWEWNEADTVWFLQNDFTGKTINEKFLFLFLQTWNTLNLQPVTPFFETHGRSYANIPDIAGSMGWYTQFYPVILRGGSNDKALKQQIEEAFRDLPQSGLTYMALDDWQKPPFPLLLNFLGNFDENRGTIARPSNISQGNMTDPENQLLAFVELNAMIVEGKLKWMLRSHPDFPAESFVKTFHSHTRENIHSANSGGYIDASLQQNDLDAIDDLLSKL